MDYVYVWVDGSAAGLSAATITRLTRWLDVSTDPRVTAVRDNGNETCLKLLDIFRVADLFGGRLFWVMTVGGPEATDLGTPSATHECARPDLE